MSRGPGVGKPSRKGKSHHQPASPSLNRQVKMVTGWCVCWGTVVMQVLKSGAKHGTYMGVCALGCYKLRTHWVTLDDNSGHGIFVTPFDDNRA